MPRSDDPWKKPIEKRSATSGKYSAGDKAANGKAERENVGKGNDGDRHVVPNKDRGGWDVVKEDRQRSSGHFDTQKEAVTRAREIVERTSRGDGEVVIHREDGRIRESDSGQRNESPKKDSK